MPQTPSIAEGVFNQLAGLDAPGQVAFIERYVQENQHETDWLEFKSGSWTRNLGSPEIRETWSVYLSAFANSGGGLLIWGIRTMPDPTTKKDSAGEVDRVPPPGALLTRLDQLQNSLTNPPVVGVRMLSIVDSAPAAKGSGYVVCYVPDGPHKPYRAESDEHYYLRIGSHCRRPSPTVLRYMFYPQVSARLEISMISTPTPAGPVRFAATLHNRGTGTAKEPQVLSHVRTNNTWHQWGAGQYWTIQQLASDPQMGYTVLEYSSTYSIHPGASRLLFNMMLKAANPMHPIIFTFTAFATDTSGQKAELIYDPAEIGDGFQKTAIGLPMA